MLRKFLFLLTLGLFFLLPFPASAKDYSIKSTDFKVQLNPDGSAQVTETRSILSQIFPRPEITN